MKKQTIKIPSDIPVTETVLSKRLKRLEEKLKESSIKENWKDYPTKRELEKVLKAYPTMKELVETLKAYPTKKDMRIEIALAQILFDEKLENLDIKNRGYRDEIMTRIDKVFKELVEMREDNAASTLHFERNDEAIAIHGKRIAALETAKN